jgi:hypothetical protein
MKLRFITTTAVASLFLLSSCLKKTDRLGFISDKGSIISEIATHNEEDPLFLSLSSVPPVETVDLLKVAVHNAKNLPSGDIKIKLALDPTLITAYNDDNMLTGTPDALVPLPFTAYTLGDPTLEITIPKGAYGEHIVTATITKAALDLTKTYAIGFKIVSVSEGQISDLAHSFMVVIGVKNPYDGVYSVVSGKVQRYTAPGTPEDASSPNFLLSGLLGPTNPDVYLVTVGATSVAFTNAAYTGVGLTWSGPMTGVAGIGGLKAVVDPATNLVTMSATEAPGGLTLTNWAGHTNSYNPATKTFTLAFRWNPTSTTREYEVVLKYKGARP